MTFTPETRCARCQGPVDVHGIYVIGYHKPAPHPMKWIYLCEGCEVGLREWLNADGPPEDDP